MNPLSLWLNKELLSLLKKRERFVSARTPPKLQAKGKSFLDFSNKDVLGLSSHPKVLRAVHEGIERDKSISTAERAVVGEAVSIFEAEKSLARFLGKERALFFSSKNQAVFSLLTATLDERDVVLFDEYSLSPIEDAAFLVGCKAIKINPWSEEVEELSPSLFGKSLFVGELSKPTTGGCLNPEFIGSLKSAGFAVFCDVTESLLSVSDFSSCDVAFGNLSLLGFGYVGFIAGDSSLIELLWSRSYTFAREAPLPSFLFDGLSEAIIVAEASEIAKIKVFGLVSDLYQSILNLAPAYKSPFFSVQMEVNQLSSVREVLVKHSCFFDEALVTRFRSEETALRFWVHHLHSDSNITTLKNALSPSLEV